MLPRRRFWLCYIINTMNKKSINKKKTLFYFLLYGGFIVFLISTDPSKLSLPFIILPFFWLFLCLLPIFLKLMQILSGHLSLPAKRRYSLALLLSAVPVCALLLKSIDQLGLRDLLILLALIIIGSFYAGRLNFSRQL